MAGVEGRGLLARKTKEQFPMSGLMLQREMFWDKEKEVVAIYIEVRAVVDCLPVSRPYRLLHRYGQ